MSSASLESVLNIFSTINSRNLAGTCWFSRIEPFGIYVMRFKEKGFYEGKVIDRTDKDGVLFKNVGKWRVKDDVVETKIFAYSLEKGETTVGNTIEKDWEEAYTIEKNILKSTNINKVEPPIDLSPCKMME